ncbi:MAG: hypothetical protein O7C61_13815 [SAR324 cluster bacterium]|nr:hypothetical protein [SAR324 cluster bacterium]
MAEGQETAIVLVKLTFALIAVILIAVFLIRPLLRSLGTRPDYLDSLQTPEMPIEEDQELEIPSEDAKPDIHSMVEQARSDPDKTARLVSSWLKERK